MSLAAEMRPTLRRLARTPGFTTVSILTLALGIAGATAAFSVINAVLLRPLPYRDPERLVQLWHTAPGVGMPQVEQSDASYIQYHDKATRSFESIASYQDAATSLTGTQDPERVSTAYVTASFLPTLGVRPAVGRNFNEEEDRPGGAPAAILSDALWRRRYGADPAMIGKTIQVDGKAREVVGIMPADFHFPDATTQLWVPMAIDRANLNNASFNRDAIGRLRPGVTMRAAEMEMTPLLMRLPDDTPGMMTRAMFEQTKIRVMLHSLRDDVVGDIRPILFTVVGSVTLVLLIACANVANLLLARAEARQREIAVRAALGAGGRRMVRQLLTESLLLTSLSAIVGLAVAGAGVRLLAWWNPASIPRIAGVTVDLRVAVFTIAMALVTSVIFGLAPALRALRAGLVESLKDGSQSASSGSARQRFRNTLVVLEMALAVVLLVGAGLMLRSLWALQSTPLGLQLSNVLTMRVALPAESYRSPEQVVGFYQRLMERVKQLPGVASAGAARSLPLGSTIGDYGLTVEGFVPPPGTRPKGDWQIVTDGYLDAMGERVVRGRGFTPADTSEGMLVALVNEELVRRYFPGRDAIGGRMQIGGGGPRPWVTIVGIVGNVRHNGLTDPVKEKFYIPHTQWHKSTGNAVRGMNLVIKSTSSPSALTSPVRDAIRALDPNLPIADVRTMEEVVSATLSTPRFTGVLLGMFALLAVVLSAIGIYGVLSYLVSRRTREIGIRMAIGAGRGQVLRMVLGSGLSLSLTGAGIGLVLAVGVGRLMRSVLHDVAPNDPATFLFVAVTLPAIALLASAVPAWRATRVDPIVALKTE